jgi:23S rRNA-/tRNA-specific pseudouridylate synthase
MDVAILHEDEALLAVDKPAGLPVAAGAGKASVLAGLLRGGRGGLFRVHRLDAETGGVLLLAKTAAARDALTGSFQAGTARLTWLALCFREPDAPGAPALSEGAEFSIVRALVPDATAPGRLAAAARGKGREAVTRVRVVRVFGRHALLEAEALTAGLPRQIRAHLACAGLPVLNDPLHGNAPPLLLSGLKRGYKNPGAERPLLTALALRAAGLAVTHPLTGAPLALSAPPSGRFAVALRQLEKFGRRVVPPTGAAS